METLIGGLCDGLEVPASGEPVMYSGIRGDGRIHEYHREADGRLHYFRTFKLPRPDFVIEYREV